MSRLSSLSSSAIKAMFSSESDESLIMLLTVYDPDTESPIIHLADGYTQRIDSKTNDDEVVYGVVAYDNTEFLFLPMQVTLPSETDAGGDTCSIVLSYVTSEAIELIRTQLNKPTKVKIELVLSGSTSTVEASFPGFYITNVTYSAEQITLDLSMISYNREPFPCYNFTPSYFPGLF